VANILTASEGSNVLRCSASDPELLALLPLVDAYLKNATGRDWTLDSTVRPEAKSAARMLLVRWHEDPGAMAAGSALGFGLSACLVQLEALALQLASSGVPDEVLQLVSTNISGEMAVDANLVLVFNHPMGSAATARVILKDAAGATVASANALDVTGKILTINPTASLNAGASYTVDVDQAADLYGQTLDTEILFVTAD
jgi:hypothetical protein